MNANDSPQYIVSALEAECDRLGVPRSFVLDLNTLTKNYQKQGKCLPIIKNKKLIGVAIDLKECNNKKETMELIFHEAKHAEQYYKKGVEYTQRINPVFTELEATFYGIKRSLEERIKNLMPKSKLNI